ncbi:hypothetical protein ACHAP8_009773 [Fusarium lateritium]
MERFEEIERHHEKYGKICGIFNASIIGHQSKLRQHMLRHSGTAFPQVVDGQATYSASTAENLRSKLPGNNLPLSVDLDLAQNMILSTPAKIRCTGGMFTKGKLAGQTVAGYPNIFHSCGRVKKDYVWIKPPDIPNPFPRPALTGTNTSRRPRRVNVQVHPPHKNRAWQASDSNDFSTVITNVWTPKKYPGWEMPRGWKMEWPCNPTSIKQWDTQCDLCEKPFCDCIATKVSSVIPRIVSAGALGQGVEATVRYQVGDFAGELVGELAPIGYYDDGWVADMRRDDLQDKCQIVCQVYARYVGNWARMVNHSCEPNVEFTAIRISGRWRILLLVIKPIEPGQAILVSYGDEYFDNGTKCLCGTESCLEHRRDTKCV